MTGTTLATAALWSYGLAAAGFAAFAIRLALGWRRSPRAALLLAADPRDRAVGDRRHGGRGRRRHVRLARVELARHAFRYGCWFAFLASLLEVRRRAPDRSTRAHAHAAVDDRAGRRRAARERRAVGRLARGADIRLRGSRSSNSEFASGSPIVGLILIEQLLRRAHPQARWSIKPLCVGLAGLFGFDLFLLADAMLYGRLDA